MLLQFPIVTVFCVLLQGYVKRQAVFACSTCTPKDGDPAGVCLACANTCHDGHDIFELYTKRYAVKIEYCFWHEVFFSTLVFLTFFFLCLSRNFRCDCGNKRFGDFKCQLIPVSDVLSNWICLTHFSYHLISLWLTSYHRASFVFTGQRSGKQQKSLQSQLLGLLLHMWPTLPWRRWSGIRLY